MHHYPLYVILDPEDLKVKVVEEAGELYHDKQVDELLNEPEHVELSDNSPSEMLSEGN